MSGKKSFSIERISFFAALCMFLSVVEYSIPKPLPFLRLGLANLPVIIALKKINIKEIFALLFFKILVQALITGTLFSYVFLFSFFGTIASGLVMLFVYLLLYRIGFVSNIAVSLSGAFLNCFTQLLFAKYIMFGGNVKYVAPVLLISSFVTGLALGIFANIFENKSKWFDSFNSEVFHNQTELPENKSVPVENLWKKSLLKLSISLIAMVTVLVCKNLWVQIFTVVLFFVLTAIKKHGKIRWIPSLIILLSITFFSLLSPAGKVLFTLGSWKITSGALVSGLQKGLSLIGMVYISQFVVDKNFRLPGKFFSVIVYIFLIYDKLTAEKMAVKKKNIISGIDEKLMSITENMGHGLS